MPQTITTELSVRSKQDAQSQQVNDYTEFRVPSEFNLPPQAMHGAQRTIPLTFPNEYTELSVSSKLNALSQRLHDGAQRTLCIVGAQLAL
jgi:hypothetical protein